MQKQQPQGKKENKKIKNELTEEQKREIYDAFQFAEEGLDPKELMLGMKALGFDPQSEDVQRIMKLINKKGTNLISYEDFMDIMIEKPSDDPQIEMQKAFKILCEEGTDNITLNSLKNICAELGENITEEELNDMIVEADKDEDGVVNEEDFVKIIGKTGMF